MKKSAISLALALSTVSFVSEANVEGFYGAGVIAVPEFDGSEDQQVVPLLAAFVQKDHYFFEWQGLNGRFNVSPVENFFFGPSIAYRFGRDDSVDNALVQQLFEVDDAIEVGGFARYLLTQRITLGLEVLTDVSDAHDGTLAEFTIGYDLFESQRLRLATTLSARYVNDDYASAYFSVSGAESALTGLDSFIAEGGINDIGITFTGNYSFNEKWGLFGIVGVQRLLGDASDSPIVEQEGDDNQFIVGIAGSYRF